MVTVGDVSKWIENVAPTALQENYDNVGLLIGDSSMQVSGTLLTIDVTEAVVDEAIEHNCNLIIAHHPLIFGGIKRITGSTYIERCIIKAIKNDIAIYVAHTNLDNVSNGVNAKIAEKIGLINLKILRPKSNILLKLVTYVPHNHLSEVQQALFNAGAGEIGKYSECSFSSQGVGTFKANKDTHPYIGAIGECHQEAETRLEVILPDYIKNKVLKALFEVHPYEEVAFDIIPLNNSWNAVGAGMIGELPEEMTLENFLLHIKKTFGLPTIRYTDSRNKTIKKVAFCGGSGSIFLTDAIQQNADAYLSGDFKYHQLFDGEDNIMIADIGHFESEQFTKEIFKDIISKKMPNFAIRISDIKTNPINYL